MFAKYESCIYALLTLQHKDSLACVPQLKMSHIG